MKTPPSWNIRLFLAHLEGHLMGLSSLAAFAPAKTAVKRKRKEVKKEEQSCGAP
jgi:hypothetical protein